MSDADFSCPNCEAKYKVVRLEAPPTHDDPPLLCLSCGGPLRNRDGKFALKYFRTDTSGREVKVPGRKPKF
jgi:hypothetical protein